jgi:CRP-like cAMP-binding protein
MRDAVRPAASNRLLASLTEAQHARLAPHLEPVEMPRGMLLEVANEPIEHAYFPDAGIGSTIATNRGGKRIEVGLFGREGMSGLPVVLGADRWPNETTMQGPDHGRRIAADRLREAMRAEPALRDRLLLYVQAMSLQAAQTAVTNGQNTIEERLARWLLMSHDRVSGDSVDLTHEFLAIMLGVRRAGVTVAMHILEGRHLIKATRGRIEVLDRPGPEVTASGSYGVAEAEHARLLGAGLEAADVRGTRGLTATTSRGAPSHKRPP